MVEWRTYIQLLLFLMKATTGFDINSGVCGIPEVNPSISARIVNGSVADEGNWPWMVLILENGNQVCGGTLISKEWILTVAHCMVGDMKSLRIFVGTQRKDASDSNAMEVIIHTLICHQDYDSSTFKDDICLIKLAESVPFSKYIIPACLPTSGSSMQVGSSCIVTGWGETLGTGSNYLLRQAEVFVLDTEQCRSWYGEINTVIPKSHLCAGHKQGGTDTCQGDSGGPLLYKESTQSGQFAYVLRGMTSFGKGCAEKERPGVYVKVVDYLEWIEENIRANSGNSCMPIQSNICGGIVNNSGTIIRNPTDLQSYTYPPNYNCLWRIVAPEGFHIQFIFQCYFLMPHYRRGCNDYILISDLTGGNDIMLCGNKLPDDHMVENNTAVFQFKSDESYEYPGFVVEIRFVVSTSTAISTIHDTTYDVTTTMKASQTIRATTSDSISIKIPYSNITIFIYCLIVIYVVVK
ncbi:serine protease 33-like [Styela clava]